MPYPIPMKISRDWLSDFIEWVETDPQKIADELTRCMGEVDEVLHQGKFLDRCVVGLVQTVEKHPNADKLKICSVQTDEGTKQVVCGGTNVRPDMHVAFSHIGAKVKWHGGDVMTLEKVKLRGVESEGMICAAEELELESYFPSKPEDGERAVADLTSHGFKVGTPLRKALGLNDVIFHIDNHAITNRADLFSHIGVARELVAMGLATWKKKPSSPKIPFTKTPAAVKLVNDVPTLIPRYCACSLTIDGAGITPDWMRRRLEATGWRPINAAIDITNYVAMEMGMPLHSFDAGDIEGTVHMRKAKKGEKVTTLDKMERELPEGALVLSDDKGIFDLLGIMGGLRSGTKDTTKQIYIHAAIIDPVSIRKAVIATGHRTDAATVYEKGVPFVAAEAGLLRTVELFLAHVPGAKVISKMEEMGTVKAKKSISIPADTFASVIGADIKPTESTKILTDLGFDVKVSGKNIAITPPAWRNDVSMKTDLVEEVARIYRYAKITPTMPDATTKPPFRDPRLHQIRDSLKESGAFELLNLAFTSPQALKKCGLNPATAVTIENPIGEEISLMRPSLLPSVLETIARELARADGTHLTMYEYGRTFEKGKPERTELCLVVAAKGKTTLKDDPVLLAKDDLARALKAAGYAVDVKKADVTMPYAHPGRSADLLCQGQVIGHLTEVHPVVREAFGIGFRTAVAIVSLDALKALTPAVTIAKPLPQFPSIELDETLPLGKRTHAEIVKSVSTLDPLLKSVTVADLYQSDSARTVTLRFTYRADDRTLTQQEVEKAHTKILAELKR